jgi:hypothetical protein
MKILAFIDTHGNKRDLDSVISKSRLADIVICGGDFTVFEDNMEIELRRINSMGKTVLLIHGNHESASSVSAASMKHENIKFIHNNYFIKDDVIFFGFGGGGFSQVDHKFEIAANAFIEQLKELEKKHNKKFKFVLVTHAPPLGTKIDDLGYHVGNKTIADFIKKHEPIIAISGHIHETFYATDHIGKTLLINPGPDGRMLDI